MSPTAQMAEGNRVLRILNQANSKSRDSAAYVYWRHLFTLNVKQ